MTEKPGMSLAPRSPSVYPGALPGRHIHDTAFAIVSALTEKMDYKLVDAEKQAFHRMVYEVSKAAIERYEKQKEREAERLRGREA